MVKEKVIDEKYALCMDELTECNRMVGACGHSSRHVYDVLGISVRSAHAVALEFSSKSHTAHKVSSA